MHDNRRLLISARDAGAAHHLAPVARLALRDEQLQVRLVASQPALSIWRNEYQLPAQAVTHNPTKLLSQAHSLLLEHRPQLLLCGLSGPDGGIDEALLSAAKARGIPSFALQDFWGDVNDSFGAYADTYLVRDSLAARVTAQRSGSATHVVGSPAHGTLPGELEQQQLRQRLRRQLKLPAQHPLILLCSQPLWQTRAYRSTLISTLRALPRGDLLVRHHPRETAAERRQLRQLLAKYSSQPWQISRAPYCSLIAAADLVLSPFSNSGLDKAQYNAQSRRPSGCPMYLLHEPGMLQLYRHWTGLQQHPLVELGSAQVSRYRSRLRPDLAHALRPVARRNCQLKAQQLQGDPDAAQQVLGILLAHLRLSKNQPPSSLLGSTSKPTELSTEAHQEQALQRRSVGA